MRYYVIAKHWDEMRQEQCEYIAGTFDKYYNANLFMKVYNEHFKANAYIVDEYKILNGRK